MNEITDAYGVIFSGATRNFIVFLSSMTEVVILLEFRPELDRPRTFRLVFLVVTCLFR